MDNRQTHGNAFFSSPCRANMSHIKQSRPDTGLGFRSTFAWDGAELLDAFHTADYDEISRTTHTWIFRRNLRQAIPWGHSVISTDILTDPRAESGQNAWVARRLLVQSLVHGGVSRQQHLCTGRRFAVRRPTRGYRGTSLIRNRLAPWDRHRTLGSPTAGS